MPCTPTRKLFTHITRSDASFEAMLTTPRQPWDGGKEAEDRLSHSLLLFHTKAKTERVILGARSELTGTMEPKYQKRLIPSMHATNTRPRYDNLRCCQERKNVVERFKCRFPVLRTIRRYSRAQDLDVAKHPF